MAYNRSKHLEAAQRHLNQGKIAQAAQEYLQILKNEPKDQVTLMTVGDLYVRQGETFRALEYFERLAQIFLADGFLTKAIAIYKKIAKLAPEETRPVERLAELYVQQGILSEARPIYLQLADLHQRAGRQTQAAALLRKLLEAEPENMRVQSRFAELSMATGNTADAAAAFRTVSEQLRNRGDHADAVKYADRALKIDPNDTAAVNLKALALAARGQGPAAISLLESIPELEKDSHAARLLLDLYLEASESARASALAHKIFACNPKDFSAAHHLASTLLEKDEGPGALALLDLIRRAMTDAGEHESLARTLTRAAEQMPGSVEPRQWLVDLYGHTSDSFRLPDALTNLAKVLEAAGAHKEALKAYEQLLDRSSENDSARRACQRLQKLLGVTGAAKSEAPSESASPQLETPAESSSPKHALDEEMQLLVTQALTDVDLFSSYGLTQKATDLLETLLERVPRHATALERLVDLCLSAGDEGRAADLAALLEEIHGEQGDSASAERFAELRRRLHRAAAPVEPVPSAEPPPSAPLEFSVPSEPPEELQLSPSDSDEDDMTSTDLGEGAVHEIDLSAEWDALCSEVGGEISSPALKSKKAPAAMQPTAQEAEPGLAITAAQETPGNGHSKPEETKAIEAPMLPAMEEVSTDTPPERLVKLDTGDSEAGILDSEGFLQALANELDDVRYEPPTESSLPANGERHKASAAASLSSTARPGSEAIPSGPLSDIFNEFRSELDEPEDNNEDPEAHYNLGVAYREMGLIDEAISEFQKVAQYSNSRAFRYTLQCCTLLGLAFTDKGQPGIAATWYERALAIPGLDQETILALRYDLGVAQELAGDSESARKSFLQVYGMNIDYRDVAERLASLAK
jgi:tetratricopeptide (TPR) repeat protein